MVYVGHISEEEEEVAAAVVSFAGVRFRRWGYLASVNGDEVGCFSWTVKLEEKRLFKTNEELIFSLCRRGYVSV